MIYVDDMNMPFGNMVMCHLLSDEFSERGHIELIQMVNKIRVKTIWIQDQGTYLEHFDICLSKKRLAIKAGAKEIHYGKELAEILQRKKDAAKTK